MANSIQEFGGKTKTFEDLDLLVVALLVLKCLSTAPKNGLPGKLTESWRRMLSSYGPGVIDLELGSLIRSSDERAMFLNVLQQVEGNLSEYGDFVPASTLNKLATIPGGVRFSDYRSDLIVTTLNSLAELLMK